MVRFDNPDTLFAPASQLEVSPARARRTKPATPIPHPQPPVFQAFPSWAGFEPTAGDTAAAAFLAAGVGLALLDAGVRQNPPSAAAWRQRLALQAAVASAKLLRLREDEGALRDAIHLAVSDASGPAGRIHLLWRELATGEAAIDADRIAAAAQLVDGVDASGLATTLHQVAAAPGDPVTTAAQAATAVFAHIPGPEGELLACWAADLVLATRLRWKRPAPLLLSGLLKPALRRGATGRRPRPDEADWPQGVARAYALACAEAQGLAAQLARRAATLLEVWPRLRARRAEQAIELLLADDCVAPTRVARRAGLSDRAARRLFERLVELDVAREVSGRSSFRLYGL